jgi:hypothetical protein
MNREAAIVAALAIVLTAAPAASQLPGAGVAGR